MGCKAAVFGLRLERYHLSRPSLELHCMINVKSPAAIWTSYNGIISSSKLENGCSIHSVHANICVTKKTQIDFPTTDEKRQILESIPCTHGLCDYVSSSMEMRLGLSCGSLFHSHVKKTVPMLAWEYNAGVKVLK